MMDIVLEKVGKAYDGCPVLRDFSARLDAGGALALLGPSGCGKTTVARLILGLEQPDSGHIIGQEQDFCCVFQEDRLCPGLSATGNLRLVLPRAWQGAEAVALAELGLSPGDCEKAAGKLSGGEKRRVALARALLAPGEVLVLDEPFKGLDEESKNRAYAFVRARREGRSLLLITHDASEAAALGAECLLMGS